MQIIYATYQFFPDSRTNTFQSISTINNFIDKEIDVELVYPDRKKTNKNFEEFYKINNKFKLTKIKHTKKYEYKSQTLFNKLIYIFNHFLFAKRVKNYLKKYKNNFILYTRSPYILFTSRNNQNKIVYEVHQITRMSKLLIRQSIKKNKKILFVVLTPYIEKAIQSLGVDKNNIVYLETGYDEKLFFEIENHKNEQNSELTRFIFGGSLDISGESKKLEKIILAFNDLVTENKLQNCILSIYCSNQDEKELLDKFIFTENIEDCIQTYNRIPSQDFYYELFRSDIGLIPLPDTHHVNSFSSSMKFFEYIRAGLVILCSNVEANKRFDYEKSVFIENDSGSIKKGILESVKILGEEIDFDMEKIKEYSYENRIEKIINKLNSF